VIRAASVRGHPGEACELIEPYLRERPDDELAAGIYAEALAKAQTEAEPGERERAALTRYGDRSGSEALRPAIDAFLSRTEWGTTVRKWADAERSRLEAEYWQAAERDQFDVLTVEVAVTYPVAGGSGSPEAGGAASGDDPVNTPRCGRSRRTRRRRGNWRRRRRSGTGTCGSGSGRWESWRRAGRVVHRAGFWHAPIRAVPGGGARRRGTLVGLAGRAGADRRDPAQHGERDLAQSPRGRRGGGVRGAGSVART
jgi:hypothetical protein